MKAGGTLARALSRLDASLATLGEGFMRSWSVVERGCRFPLSRFALRLKFTFYPLLALVALAKSILFRLLRTALAGPRGGRGGGGGGWG